MKTLFFLIFYLFVNINFGQTILLRYVGDDSEKIHLSYNYLEFNKDFDILSSKHKNLEFGANSCKIISSNDYFRKTFIFAQPNDTIDFKVDQKGLINYWCKSNIYRKSESEFVNLCFRKFGNIDLYSNKKIFSKFYIENALSAYNDRDNIQEIEYLNKAFKEDKVSEQFYKYFTSIYWALALANNLESNNLDSQVIQKIEKSFCNASYLLNIFEYRRLLILYSSIVQRNFKAVKLKHKLEVIINQFADGQIKDYLLYYEVRNYLDANKNNILSAEQYNIFIENCRNTLFLDDIRTDYIGFQNNLSFSDIISKYKGKLLLVDLWASWCMPCREEFAYEIPLIQKFPTVNFIFISTDTRKAAWLNAMASYPKILNNENNYLLRKSSTDKLLKKINLTTIPRYVLFGKNGEIININAPRPSTKELENLILKNL